MRAGERGGAGEGRAFWFRREPCFGLKGRIISYVLFPTFPSLERNRRNRNPPSDDKHSHGNTNHHLNRHSLTCLLLYNSLCRSRNGSTTTNRRFLRHATTPQSRRNRFRRSELLAEGSDFKSGRCEFRTKLFFSLGKILGRDGRGSNGYLGTTLFRYSRRDSSQSDGSGSSCDRSSCGDGSLGSSGLSLIQERGSVSRSGGRGIGSIVGGRGGGGGRSGDG